MQALEAHLSRGTTSRDEPLMQECLAQIMPGTLEMAIEPDLREMVCDGLAGAETVRQAHRLFEGGALSEIGSDLIGARDKALERLRDSLTAGQLMMAARAASNLSRLGGKAEGLIFFADFAERAAMDTQSRSAGGSAHAKELKSKIGCREEILTGLIWQAVAAAGKRHGWNNAWLARWMLNHWPSDCPSASDLKPGTRVVCDWVRARRKSHADDFLNPAGPIPDQEGQGVSVGAARDGPHCRSSQDDTHHQGVTA